MKSLLVCLCLVILLAASNGQVTTDVESNAIADIRELIANLTGPNAPMNLGNPAAKLVRLAFHDCPGGCDGCLNSQNMENNGLMPMYNEINRLYLTYDDTGMTRADFIALAGTVAIRTSVPRDCMQLRLPRDCVPPMPNITIKYGRRDCQTSPTTTDIESFPDAHGNLEHVLNYFREQMNMTTRETVAIIGAHSLGRTNARNSGFNGPWAPPTNVFDNGFYRVLSGNNNNWFQMEINDTRSPFFPDSRYQWTIQPGPGGNAPPIMLNADMALFKEIDPDDTGLETNDSCKMSFNNCDPSTTADIVLEFAQSNIAFMEAFGPAFQKMIQTGYREDELITAREVDPTTSTTPTSSPTSTPTPTPSGAGNVQAIYLLITFASFILLMVSF